METYRTETNEFQKPNPPKEFNLPAPNSNAILTLGILSIVTCCCCSGFLGIILAVIAIILAAKSKREISRNSDLYDEKTFGKLHAGKTCAVIGLVIALIMLIFTILVLILMPETQSIISSVNGWDGLGY